MKKKFLIVLIALLSFNLFAENTYDIQEGTYFKYDEFVISLDQKLEEFKYVLKYDEKNDMYDLVLPSDSFCELKLIAFKKDDIKLLKKNIEKYFEWEKIAKENQVKITKELPNADIKTIFGMSCNNNVYTAKNFILNFTFYSENEDCYFLRISADSMASDQTEFVWCEIANLYFNHNQIKSLYDAFSEENLKQKKEEHEKQIEINNLFQ